MSYSLQGKCDSRFDAERLTYNTGTDGMRLVANGQELQDRQTVAQLGLQENSQIMQVLRLRGG